MEAEPTMPTTCDHCGKAFNTSRQHPKNYCSIACEEGRAPLAKSDPASEGYHLHLQGEPESLVGKTLVANAFKRTCYSPDWHRDYDDYNSREIVSHDPENEVLVVKRDVVIGTVTAYENGHYVVETENLETGTMVTQRINPSDAVSKIKDNRWWVDG